VDLVEDKEIIIESVLTWFEFDFPFFPPFLTMFPQFFNPLPQFFNTLLQFLKTLLQFLITSSAVPQHIFRSSSTHLPQFLKTFPQFLNPFPQFLNTSSAVLQHIFAVPQPIPAIHQQTHSSSTHSYSSTKSCISFKIHSRSLSAKKSCLNR